jgi:hypothetical protein
MTTTVQKFGTFPAHLDEWWILENTVNAAFRLYVLHTQHFDLFMKAQGTLPDHQSDLYNFYVVKSRFN